MCGKTSRGGGLDATSLASLFGRDWLLKGPNDYLVNPLDPTATPRRRWDPNDTDGNDDPYWPPIAKTDPPAWPDDPTTPRTDPNNGGNDTKTPFDPTRGGTLVGYTPPFDVYTRGVDLARTDPVGATEQMTDQMTRGRDVLPSGAMLPASAAIAFLRTRPNPEHQKLGLVLAALV
jgi:hypothetical protein